MKKELWFITSALVCLLAGILLYALTNEWIIIRFPFHQTPSTFSDKQIIERKKVRLIFWHEKKWLSEDEEMIWTQKPVEDLTHILNRWLTLLDEEEIMGKKVTIQSVAINHSGNQAYISFDQNPFEMEDSTFTKWMWIEGLLKTIRYNNIHIQGCYFLVHHNMLYDDHLDFSHPWPLEGFLGE